VGSDDCSERIEKGEISGPPTDRHYRAHMEEGEFFFNRWKEDTEVYSIASGNVRKFIRKVSYDYLQRSCLKREERKASWGISWGIYILSPWVILLLVIWRSPVIPLSYFHRGFPSLISIGTSHLLSIIRDLPLFYYCQGTSFSSLTVRNRINTFDSG
jgi:hypothetical protein